VTDHPVDLAPVHPSVHAEALRVHAITGRTDQSVQDICALYPEHEAVIAYTDAIKAALNQQ
jgi:hypothetical protein